MSELSKQYGTEERQNELLSMIKKIDMLFMDNGIKYSLCGGSLLGAIRENGFIPWDDDIDIMMDRENYNKTIGLFSSKNSEILFGLRREHWIDRIHKRDSTDPNDASIDIFVMDHCPDNAFLRRFKVLVIRTLQGMMKPRPTNDDHSIFYKICLWITYILGKPFSMDRKYAWYKAISEIGNKKPARFITGYNDYFNLVVLRYSGKLMDHFIKHQFEDTELSITAEYDNYLSTQYGDYMTPPPIEERIPLHI